jgi:holo-[acyl-carrier protein] synthase
VAGRLAHRVIGIGIDLVDIARLGRVLTRRPGMAERLFTDEERQVTLGGLAARFAAKEAAMKALGVGLGAFGFHDVAIRRQDGGAPALIVTGAAAALAADRGVRAWKVSLTHTDALAEAVVVAL